MAGSRPSAAELAAIPRIGEVRPRIVTGAPTSAVKRESMQRDIAASQQGQQIKRNKRAIAREAAAIRQSDTAAPTDDGWREGRSFSDLNSELCAFIKRSDWWPYLSEPAQENLIDLYWRQYALGRLSMKAWLLEADTVRLELGLKPRSIEAQREDTIRQQQRAARYDYSYRSTGGW